jgi:UDP-glucose:(heptosyl)LPS alpha-1,3-glucosyltransferase
MNIALVVHDLHERGGHSLYTRILADELSRRHEVTVFANRCERPLDAGWSFEPVRALRLNSLSTVQTFPIGLRSLYSKLAEFDIRHMQGFCGGQPNVVTAHICLDAYLNSLRNISRQSQMSLRLMAAAESRFYRRYEGHVIAVSQKIACELREFYEVSDPISVIPHGVDPSRFSSENRERYRTLVRSEIGIGEDSTLALYVGDLTKSHTHLKAVAAAAPEVEFVIVTASPQYHWSGRNVHILQVTSGLARYYAAADAFIFPTTYDAFGMVVLEAMASGLPVFTSDRAGAAELITSEKDGFVIRLDDWVEATTAGLRDRDSLRAIGCEAEKTARRHDWLTAVRNVEQIYAEVVAAHEAILEEPSDMPRQRRSTLVQHFRGRVKTERL